MQKRINVEEAKKNISKIAGLLVLSATLTMIISILYIETSQIRENYLIGEQSATSACLYFIVLITMICVPLNLSFSILHGKGQFLSVVIIQGMMPVLNLFGYVLFGSILRLNSIYLALIPSVSFLLSTLCAVKVSKFSYFVDLDFFTFDKGVIGKELKVGFSNLVVVSVVGWSAQLPRYYLSTIDNASFAVEYAKISIFLIPSLALVATYGYSFAKGFREIELSSTLGYLLGKIKRMFLFTIAIIIIFSVLSRMIGNRIDINLSVREQFLFALLLTTSMTWIFLAVIQSVGRIVSRNARVLALSFIVFILLTIIISPSTLFEFVMQIVLPFNLVNTFLLISPIFPRKSLK